MRVVSPTQHNTELREMGLEEEEEKHEKLLTLDIVISDLGYPYT